MSFLSMCDLKALFIEVRVIEHFHIKSVLKILLTFMII